MTESPAVRRIGWRRWRVALVVALAVLALPVALLFAAAQGYLTRPITRLVSEKLGRQVAADGGVRVEFGSVIHIIAMRLRLANSAWAGPVDMLHARRVDIEIDARSLFHETVIVRNLTADGVELHLQRNARGENNWSFKVHPEGPSTVLPVVFETVSIPGAKVSFAGPRLERPLELSLASIGQREGADGMLVLRAVGMANDTPLELRIDSGPFASLVSARNFRIKARGRLGDITLGLDTRIDSLATPADTELLFSLNAPQAAYLASHLGLRNLGNGPVSLALAISPDPAGTGVTGRLNGQIGEFDLGAQGSLAVNDGVPAFSVQGHVAGPDLSRIGGLAGLRGLPAESFRLQLDAQRSGPMLQVRKAVLELADARLEADGVLDSTHDMSGNELSIKVNAADVAKLAQRFRLELPLRGPLELSGKLRLPRSRELEVNCSGTTNYGSFTTLGPIQLVPGGHGTRLAWTAAGKDLGPLALALKFPDPPRGTFKGKGDVEWTREGILLRGVRLESGGEAASISGKLGRPAFGRGADLHLDVSGPNAARMASRFGYGGFPAGRYRVTGRIQRQADRTVFSAVSAELADARLQLDGTLGAAPGFAATDLGFTISGPALADYAGLLPEVTLPRGPFSATGRLVKRAETVLRLDKLQLEVGNATATVSADVDLPVARHSLRYELDTTVPEPTALFPDSTLAGTFGHRLQLSASGARAGDTWTIDRLRVSSDRGLLSTQGALEILPQLSTAGAQAELRAPSLKVLGTALDLHWPELPIELHARLSRNERDLLLDALGGRLGGTAFTGRAAAHGLQGKPDLDVEVNFVQLNLDRYLNPPVATKIGKSAAAKGGQARGRVIPDTEVAMPELGSYTVRLAVRADGLRLWGTDLKDFQLRAALRDGRLNVDPLAATGANGSVSLKGALAAKGKGISVQLTGTGSDMLVRLVPFGIGGADASRYTAQVELQANGSRWSELAATLNGRVRLVGRGGRLKNSLLLASSGDFVQQLLTGLNPMATRQPTTDVDCSAYLLRAKDGIVTTDPALVLRTKEVDIVSAGAIDLHTEKIDFNFKIRARTGLGFGVSQLVNPYLKVNGTLASPGVTLDPTGALVNGGAAFATAGLSVVATTLWDRFVHESDPCGAAVAESDRRAAQQPGTPAQP